MSPATTGIATTAAAATAKPSTNVFWLLPGIMADEPRRENQTPRSSQPPQPSRAGTTTPTQYEFIMTTGEESATTARQKLKTIRSHVMKNYLTQQQRQGSGETSLSVAQSERRKGKQRARSSRSPSYETESSPLGSSYPRATNTITTEIGLLFSGFSTGSTEPAYGDNQSNFGKSPLLARLIVNY